MLTHHWSRANGHYLRQKLVLISLSTGHPAVRLKFAHSVEIRGVKGTSNHDQSLEKSRQNFYNERLNLKMPRAKILSCLLQRRRINEAMNYWTPLSLKRRARPPFFPSPPCCLRLEDASSPFSKISFSTPLLINSSLLWRMDIFRSRAEEANQEEQVGKTARMKSIHWGGLKHFRGQMYM